MKTNTTKALELVDKGLSAKTVSKLTESQIDVLYSKLISEQPAPIVKNKTVKQIELPSGSETTVGNVSVSNKGGKTTITPTTEEVKEDDDVNVHVSNDPDATEDGMGIFEEDKEDKDNPWAICTAQLGKVFKTSDRSQWSPKQKAKYERCVKDVKKSLKEGKNPVSLFLENEIMKIVEKNLPPRITKGDLVKYITENGPAVAPTKPKPTVKPGKPDTRPRPSHPGKNPNPGVNPAPKAKKVSPEDAKDKVIDLILNLLQK